MGFQGSLDTVGLADIFQLFGFGRKSGALHLRHDGEHGVIHFAEGDVFYATMSPGDVIGNLLVRADLVTPEQWKAVLAEAGDGLTQGEVLGTVDGIDTVAVEVFLRERVEDTVFRIAQWDGGEFELEDDANAFGPAFRFAAEPLLATAERRMDEWRRICEVVPSTAMGVQVVRDLPQDLPEVTLDRDQWRLLATITPGCDISEVAASLGETEFRTCRTLVEMLERGVVELIAEEKLAALRTLLAPDTDLEAPAREPARPQFLDEAAPTPAPASAAVPAPVGADGWADPDGDDGSTAPATVPDPGDAGESPKLSLAELAAAAEAPPPHVGTDAPHLGAGEADAGFVVGDLMAEYVPPDAAPEPPAHAYLDAVTPPPAVFTSFEQPVVAPAQPAFPDTLLAPGSPEAPGLPTGEVPAPAPAQAPAPQPQPQPQPQLEYPPDYTGETPLAAVAGADGNGGGDGVGGDSELDKSLILRLIAGVKSL